jgi:large subunit ribosomal protein L25
MSERIVIQAEPRNVTGKRVRQLRSEGWVPAVIYGKSDPLVVQLAGAELRRVLRQAGETELIDIKVGGELRTVLARDIQKHITRADLMHVDFYEVDLREKLRMEVPLVAIGGLPSSIASLGTVTLVLQEVELEALPTDLPPEIEVDLSLITDPDITLHIRDLRAPEGVTILTAPDTAITTFSYIISEEEAELEEEAMTFAPSADAVEVVSRAKEDEDF